MFPNDCEKCLAGGSHKDKNILRKVRTYTVLNKEYLCQEF